MLIEDSENPIPAIREMMESGKPETIQMRVEGSHAMTVAEFKRIFNAFAGLIREISRSVAMERGEPCPQFVLSALGMKQEGTKMLLEIGIMPVPRGMDIRLKENSESQR